MTGGRVGEIETFAAGNTARQMLGRWAVQTPGPGFTELTDVLAPWVAAKGLANGLLTVFCRHTSASLVIQENADPDVRQDLLAAFDRLAPRDVAYVHST